MRSFLFPFCVAISICAPALAQNLANTVPATPAPVPLLTPYSALGGPKITVQNAVYSVENITPGSFGVTWKLSQPDASKIARFTFDWKPSADTKVNFFFKVSGKYYAVILSGSEKVRAGTRILGRATTTNLPDGFQRVEIPLRAWLLALNPNASSLPIEEVLLGNWSNEGYLLAGVGGNGAGANYKVRAVNLRDVSETKSAPEVKVPTLKNNEILWPLTDFAGIETNALKFRITDQSFDLNSPYLSLDSKIVGDNLVQTVRLEAGDAGINLSDGQNVPVVLEGIKGTTGSFATGTTDGTVSNNVKFVAAEFKETPPFPRLNIAGVNVQNDGDFETNIAGFTAGSAVVERLPAPNRKGYALKLTNPKTATRFDTILTPKLDVAQFPAFNFDYRCDDRVRLNFQFRWDGIDYSIRFLDRDNFPRDSRIVVLDPFVNPKADNEWTTASYDLLAALKKARPDAKSFQIDNLTLTDQNWMGNARGVSIWLDNFRFVPLVPKNFKANVTLRDLSGISGISYGFDQSPSSTPDESVESSSGGPAQIDLPETERGAGIWYLHVRAKNHADHWSDTAHFPVFIGQ